jgi:hypothetical protein
MMDGFAIYELLFVNGFLFFFAQGLTSCFFALRIETKLSHSSSGNMGR